MTPSIATRIPPHICQAVLIKNTSNVCKDMAEHVKDAVKQAFEEKAEECGQMMDERMKNMMEEYHPKMEHLIDVKLAELNNSPPS
jgi:hypothetical protein